MNGVYILNIIYPAVGLQWGLEIAFCIFTALSFSCLGHLAAQDCKDKLAIIASTILSVLSFIFAVTWPNVSDKKLKYEVTVSPEVSFVEFMQKYEIIGKRGEIYIIEERGDGNARTR